MTEFNEFNLDDESAALFDAPPTRTAEIIDIRQLLIDGLSADAAVDSTGDSRSPEDLDWQDLGLCKESDPEAFFPEKGGSTKQAKDVCKRCPVIEKCLQYALANDERFGIWGGKSETERRKILKEREEAAEAGLGRAV